MIVEAQAPTRIDLAGGTLDIPPLDLLVVGACTVNVAIDLMARARVEPIPSGTEIHSIDRDVRVGFSHPREMSDDRELPLLSGLLRHFLPDGGVRLTTDCGSPAGAGLGGSSALAVAVGGALARYASVSLDPDQLLAVARDVETRVLGVPTGVQDYLAALHGGGLAVVFEVGGRKLRRIEAGLEELREQLVLIYTGQPRSSGINNWEVTRGFIDGDAGIRRHLEGVAQQARRALLALENRDLRDLADAMGAEWEERRRLAPGVSTPLLDSMFDAARQAGALAGKVCGAGGGGCAVLIAPRESRLAVEAAARQAGARVLEFGFATTGLAVTAG